LPDFNQIWIFSTYSNKNPEYQISTKFFQWQQSWYTRTDGLADRHEEANRRFSRLRERA